MNHIRTKLGQMQKNKSLHYYHESAEHQINSKRKHLRSNQRVKLD